MKKAIDKYRYYSLILIAITLLLPMLINNIAIIIFVILSVLSFFYNKSFFFTKINLVLISFFLFSLFSLTYTCNVYDGFKNIEKYLSFIVFPIFIVTNKISNSQLKKILIIFAVTTLLLFIIAILIAITNAFNAKSFYIFNPLNKVIENYFFYHRLSHNIGFHAIYLSVFMTFSNTIFIERLITTKKNIKLLSVAILITSTGIVLLQSFSVIFSFVIILFSFFLFFYNSLSLNGRRLIFIFTSIIFILTIMIFIKKASTNYNFLNYNLSNDINNKNWNSLNIRLAKWECAIEVANENLPLGTGVGCQQIKLNNKYIDKNFVIGMNKEFSTHNQYLHSLVQLGIPGLILILLLYYLSIFNAIRINNLIFLALIILLIITSITENVLSINKGIVFFTFFITILNNKKLDKH